MKAVLRLVGFIVAVCAACCACSLPLAGGITLAGLASATMVGLPAVLLTAAAVLTLVAVRRCERLARVHEAHPALRRDGADRVHDQRR